jgi:hypothetical protein
LKAPRRRAIMQAERTATVRILAPLLVVLCPLAAAPAWADAIYKWVDAQGTVHYSNTKPSQTAEVLAEDRVSTIQSEPAFARTPAGASRAETDFLARRVERLERELAAQRQAAQYADAADTRAMQAAYDRCLAERRVDCDGGYGSPYVVVTAPLLPVRRHLVRTSRFHPVRGITGRTAGNVVTFGTATSSRAGRGFR